MHVLDSRRVRDLIIRVEEGEDILETLRAALAEARAAAAYVRGAGSIAFAELTTPGAAAGAPRRVRSLEGQLTLVSLDGYLEGAAPAGERSGVFASLALEGPLGLETAAGELGAARARAVTLHAICFGPAEAASADLTAPPPPAAAPEAPPQEPPEATAIPTATPDPPPLPPRPVRPAPEADDDLYPEPGDRVNHFHFGECTVLSSDGERIKLRQDKDGRVREVALTMLRIEPPTTSPEGSRTFRLSRKH